jgi:riboflavin kinase/FMN adenylyltransferase
MVIGFFDGVHRGHQKIINLCIRKARYMGSISTALTFDHPPINILKNRIHKKLILTYDEKIEIIKDLGIDVIVAAGIEEGFLSLTPIQFCDQILIGLFNIRQLYIGKGFRFGKDAAGDTVFLRRHLGKNGIKVNEVSLVRSRGEAISSTMIRKYYSEGNIKRIRQLLGRDPYLKGEVVKGAGRGKKLGIPTVNIDADKNLVLPEDGVYLGNVSRSDYPADKMPAVINIGDNPTFGDAEKRIESHILDFNADLYKKMIRIDFLKRLRREIRFDEIEDLKKQIHRDIERARAYFRSRTGK